MSPPQCCTHIALTRKCCFIHVIDELFEEIQWGWTRFQSTSYHIKGLDLKGLCVLPCYIMQRFHVFRYPWKCPINKPLLQRWKWIIVKDWGFPGSSDGKESTCNAWDPVSILGWGRSPGKGNGNPLQHSCLGNPMDREAWRATVNGVKD